VADKLVSISLQRTTCYGSCPAYLVTLAADGTVTFEGREHVGMKGTYTKKIDPAKLAPVIAKLEEIRFWTLRDRYRTKSAPGGLESSVSDLPTRTTTVRYRDRTKAVENYYGGPDGLAELEKLIDETAGVAEWVGAPVGVR
jgi:hypothetical protein